MLVFASSIVAYLHFEHILMKEESILNEFVL
jgi:hypothetical protein